MTRSARTPDAAQSFGSEASITPERRRTAHHSSGSEVGSSQIGKRAASVLRRFSALCLAILTEAERALVREATAAVGDYYKE
jgi:hypothetical protein